MPMKPQELRATPPALTQHALKWIACVAMTLDHGVKALHIRGTARFVCSKVIGRIAFPLFCFLLAEGFFHTRDRKKYLLRVVLFALISEIPFDLALFGGRRWYPGYQNTLWSLSLGLLLFFLLNKVEEYRDLSALTARVIKAALVGLVCMAAHLLHTDYGARGILCLAAFYFLRTVKPKSLSGIWACVLINLNRFNNPGAFLSLLPLHFYNGERGSSGGKYFFYIYYPAHLFLLYLLAHYALPPQ